MKLCWQHKQQVEEFTVAMKLRTKFDMTFYNTNSFSIFLATILLSIITGLLLILGPKFKILTIGLFLAVLISLYLKSLGNLFLLWLFLFSFFSTEPIYLLTIMERPIFTFDRIVVITLFLFLLIQSSMKKRKLLPINKIEVSMLLFFLFILYSMRNTSALPFHGLKGIVDGFFIPFIIYFLAKNLIQDEKQLNRFINILIALGFFLSLMGIYEYLTINDILPSKFGLVIRVGWLRVNGPYPNDPTFGVILVVCIFAALYKYSVLNRKIERKAIVATQKGFLMISICFSLVALLFNFIRGIWLAFLLGLVFWLIAKKERWKISLFYVFILFLILTMSFSTIQSSYLYQTRITNTQTINSRLQTFRVLFDEFKENPIIGVGIFNHIQQNESLRSGVHNSFLAILADMGIVGLSMFLFLLWLMFNKGVNNYRLANSFNEKEFWIMYLCVFIAYLVSGMSLLTVYIPTINKLFFAFIGLAISKNYRMQKLAKTK